MIKDRPESEICMMHSSRPSLQVNMWMIGAYAAQEQHQAALRLTLNVLYISIHVLQVQLLAAAAKVCCPE